MQTIRSAIVGALLVLAPAALASQASLVTPAAPLPMTSLATFLNAALLSLGSCNSGASAPTNGPGAATFAGECWINTTTNPWVVQKYDGTTWVSLGTIDTSAHTFAPAGTSSDIKLLNTLTASNSATLSDTTSLTAAYDNYLIVFENVVPVTNAASLDVQIHSGGTFKTTGYINSLTAFTTAIDLTGSGSNSNTAGGGVSGYATITAVNSTSVFKVMRSTLGYYSAASTMIGVTNSGAWNAGQGAVDGLQFLEGTGNISTGTIKIYGLK